MFSPTSYVEVTKLPTQPRFDFCNCTFSDSLFSSPHVYATMISLVSLSRQMLCHLALTVHFKLTFKSSRK